MKATLEFDLDQPDEVERHLVAAHAVDLYLALSDVDNWLRSKVKHGHTFKDADQALDHTRDRLHVALAERGVSLDMLS